MCFQTQNPKTDRIFCENRFERNYVVVLDDNFDRDVSMRNKTENENEKCGLK